MKSNRIQVDSSFIEHWNYRGLEKSEVRPMTKLESGLFMLSSITVMKIGEMPSEMLAESVKASPYVEVMINRLSLVSGKEGFDAVDGLVCPSVIAFLTISDSFKSFGKAIMWAYTLAMLAVEQGRAVSLDDIAMKYFKKGLPSEDAMRKAWESQKGYTLNVDQDNMLDNKLTWEHLASKLKTK